MKSLKIRKLVVISAAAAVIVFAGACKKEGAAPPAAGGGRGRVQFPVDTIPVAAAIRRLR